MDPVDRIEVSEGNPLASVKWLNQKGRLPAADQLEGKLDAWVKKIDV